MLSAKIALETGERNAPPQAAGISLEPAIAVVQIASVPDAKKFYVDFLGFTADWGWPDDDGTRSLYAQISRSGVTLHLSTHGADRGATELLIRMSGLATLHAELSTKPYSLPLNFRQTPDDRRELQVTDPFGNRLRFSENNPPGTSNR
jgi:catechol 2,3-dioxygenase-like lactoylglutathione lyase family enzyme